MAILPRLFIFDLDGTLANIEHRKHWLEKKDDPERWRKFYAECHKDDPNIPIVRILNSLLHTGYEVWIVSGRSSEVRQKTIDWLQSWTLFNTYGDLDVHLIMRDEGDYTADDILKEKWLHNMLDVDRKRLMGVFDDRKRVVDMWRRNGVPCFQVDEGDF